MWFIDVISAGGEQTGSGPITSARSWRSTARMDRGGSFSFDAPLSDPKVAALEPLQIVRCTALIDGEYREVGAGSIDRIERSVQADGSVIVTVSGGDLIAVLGTLSVFAALLDGSTAYQSPQPAVSHATALTALSWTSVDSPVGVYTFVPAASPPVDSLTGKWNYESLLQAMIMLADKCQVHFYYSGWKQVTFTEAQAASGVRAVRGGTSSSETASITELVEIEDAEGVVSFLVPFGGGNADARLTINATTQTPPAGYSLTDISVESAPSTRLVGALSNNSAAGVFRSKALVWNDITPISSTDGDIQAAADALYFQALRYLQQHSYPEKFYRLALAQCPRILRPTQKIRVSYQDRAQGIDIEEDLIILETITEVTAQGPTTTGLIVATIDRWPESDSGAVVTRLASGQMYQSAPQLNANSYVISYNKPVDETETASFRFRFDSEVVQLTRCTFDFQILPLESTVKSIGLETETGGTITTSFTGNSGDSGTASTGLPSNNASGEPSNNTSDVPSTNTSGNPSNNTSDVPSTNTSGNPSNNNTGSPTGGDVISAGRHQHVIGITLGGTVTYPIGFGAAGTSGGLVSTVSGSSFNLPTNEQGNHTHDLSNHTHNLNNHTHSLNNHTHNLNNHTHSLSSHTHTLNNHQHTITHIHDISHTHTFTPEIDTLYGIFRDSGANTFALADIEYSVDATTWYAFTPTVNGFASLGDSWYRIDITALIQNSTTLRPLSNNNALQIRRKSTGATKKAMIEGQLNVRTIIQAIAAL